MSLDITLVGGKSDVVCVCNNCGDKHTRGEEAEHFSVNITHNLNKLAEAAGLYKAIWYPEEIRISHANYLINTLEEGLKRLRANPDKYRGYEPENKWGTYDTFVEFVEKYLHACKAHPEARIVVDR